MEPDWKTVGVLGAARGGRPSPEEPIGTQNLLAGITTTKSPAAAALSAEGASKTAVVVVLRQKLNGDDPWHSTDDAEASVASTDVLGEHGDKGQSFSGAAAGALRSAMDLARAEGAKKLGVVHLLRALLDGGDHRGTELLAACGAAPDAVLARLDGDGAERDDGLAPSLHPTREILLGRAKYVRMPRWKRWVAKSFGVNWAAMPVEWVRREADEQARRLGHATVGTEHVLLAVLSTHEVVTRYPHFAAERTATAHDRFAGGERLAAAGIDYAAVRAALSGGGLDLSADPRPVERYFADAEKAFPRRDDHDGSPAREQSTGPLVEALLAEETRARQLVHRLAPAAEV